MSKSNAAKAIVHGASIVDTIDELDHTVLAVAFRAIANSSLHRAITNAQIHLRRLQYDNGYTGIDKLNEEMADADVAAASKEQLDQAGMDSRDYNPLAEAQKHWAIYQYAKERCLVTQGKHDTIAARSILQRAAQRTDYDAPMQLEAMIDLMVTPTVSTKEAAAAKVISQLVEIDVEELSAIQQAAKEMQGAQLEDSREDIQALLESFTDFADVSSLENLDAGDMYMLGVKIVRKIWAQWWKALNHAVKTGDLKEMGSLPILKDGADQIEAWLEQHGTDNFDAMIAIEAERGFQYPALEDKDNVRPRNLRSN